MTRGINVNVDVNLMVENNSRKKWNSDKCQKKSIRHCTWEEDYAWNPSICCCECDKDCEIGEYLKVSPSDINY